LPYAFPPGAPLFRGRKHNQAMTALERLIDRHRNGNYADYTVKLTFPRIPNGVYLLKGGGPDVWCKFGVPREWRKPQGFHSWQALRDHPEYWTRRTQALAQPVTALGAWRSTATRWWAIGA
jgi:hypothetical protein